jgi:hypothetical protein
MKSIYSQIVRTSLVLLVSVMVCSALAQPVAPPKDPDPPGTLIHPPDQPYNGAPVDGGLVILLSFVGIYTGKLFLSLKKENK